MFAKIASALAALTALIHLFVGGADCLAPVLAAGLTPNAAGAMHACWHFVSVFLLSSVLVLWRGGEPAVVFALLWLSFAVVFIYVGLYQDGPSGLTTNPQWTILLLTAGAALLNRREELSQHKIPVD